MGKLSLTIPADGSVVKSEKYRVHGTAVGKLVPEDVRVRLEALRRGK